MQIQSNITFIPDEQLEQLAYALIERYQREIEPVIAPPVPVEKIADFLLELGIEWATIPDSDEEPILAYIDPRSRTIRFNENRQNYFEQYKGTYEFTLAHEIGHFNLHTITDEVDEAGIGPDQATRYLYRNKDHKSGQKDRREWQAERFASYLLMPSYLLLPAIQDRNLLRWSELYDLRDMFNVSITALKIRLENLGYLYVASNGRLYPSKQDAVEDLRNEALESVNKGKIYSDLDQPDRALSCYERAVIIAYELNNKRDIAYRSWTLGLLYEETDPAYAADLMSACVEYEREIGHPDAEMDAERVTAIRNRLSRDISV